MADKNTIKSRILLKNDTQENWDKAINFIPLPGEIIIYNADDEYDYQRVKIGNGTTTVTNLPFVYDIITDEEIGEICGASIERGEAVEL